MSGPEEDYISLEFTILVDNDLLFITHNVCNILQGWKLKREMCQ